MSKEMVRCTAYLDETLALLVNPGRLLVSQGRDGLPNAMTIGCGTIGRIWGMSVFTVLVRLSRYTFSRLEESDAFTVDVPGTSLHDAVAFCGRPSGRNQESSPPAT